MTRVLTTFALLTLLGCGTHEETPPAEATPAEPTTAPEPVPEPEPEPEPEPVPNCPTDAWGVFANSPNRATTSGVEAAGWAREMGQGWERLRVCKTIEDAEVRMECSPIDNGAECSIAMSNRVCTAQVPRAALPVAVGQFVDTAGLPDQAQWRCSNR